jgi:hypothetical protein
MQPSTVNRQPKLSAVNCQQMTPVKKAGYSGQRLRLFCILPAAFKRMLMPDDKDLDSRAKRYRLRRSIMDYGMGIVIFCLGIFFLLASRFGVTFGIDDQFRYLFAGLCILYGLFRIYRGYKKNYFN